MITSRENETVKHCAKLVKSASYRRERGLFTAEGVRICRDGVRSGFSPELFLYTPQAAEKYAEDHAEVAAASKKALEVSGDIFARLSDTKSPQGFFCVFNLLDKQEFPYRINRRGNYLACERIQDPSNLGTMLSASRSPITKRISPLTAPVQISVRGLSPPKKTSKQFSLFTASES